MSADHPMGTKEHLSLRVYNLGCLEFEKLACLQRRLHHEISEDRGHAALVLCEHPGAITVGRQGSRSHIRLEPEELTLRNWPIRWVNRGGGCILHSTGQLAIYPIFPLDRLGWNVSTYLDTLANTLHDVVADFSVHGTLHVARDGVCVGQRLLAAIGINVRDWITGYGAYLNVDPALDPFRHVRTYGNDQAMTSLERERRGRVRPSLVRERLLEHVQARFGVSRCVYFSDHPALSALQDRPALTPQPLSL
jgi:lipoyl(octanoyl) transferase